MDRPFVIVPIRRLAGKLLMTMKEFPPRPTPDSFNLSKIEELLRNGFRQHDDARYLKEAKYVRNATELSEMQKFQATVPHLRKYSGQYNLHYLLMAARA